jgi:hypothetical protein
MTSFGCVVSGLHNHVLDKDLEGCLTFESLREELLDEMTRNLVPLRNIISTLKERNAKNVTAIKQLYNIHHKLKLGLFSFEAGLWSKLRQN